MTVVHLLTNFHPVIGGLESFVQQLCTHLRSHSIDARVLCLNRADRTESRLPSHAVISGIPVHRVEFLDLKFYKPAMLPLEELRQADVIHVHGIGANLDYVAATQPLHRRPFVVSTHGGIFHTASLGRLKQFYFRQITRRSLARAARVVACGRQDMALFSPITSNIEMIENAVELPSMNPAVDRMPLRCLYVGRFAANKQLDRLLEVFAAANVAGSELRIVGPDWQGLGGQLRELAARLNISDRATFVGAVDAEALQREYAAASVLLSASRHEGFGMTVLEAMAAGVVPVVNSIPAFTDLITDQQEGFLTRFDDVPGAGALLSDVMQRDLRAMRVNAIARARSLSWEVQLPRWMELFRRIAQAT